MENRLSELESCVAYQDNTIQELNDVVIKQQAQIDTLTAELRAVKSQLEFFAASLTQSSELTDEIPPHY